MRTSLSAAVALGCVLMAGCFSAATMSALQGPQGHARSPSFDARPTWRTAVLPPAEQVDVAEPAAQGLYDYAGMVLLRTGRFQVVDRALVDALLREQQFGHSGAVDANTAVRLGKLLGAEAVMTVSITSLKHDPFFSDEPQQREAELHVKIISVETGEVLYSAVGQGSDFEGGAGALRMALEVALHPLGRK